MTTLYCSPCAAWWHSDAGPNCIFCDQAGADTRVGWVDGPTLHREDFASQRLANTRGTYLEKTGKKLVCVYQVFGFEES